MRDEVLTYASSVDSPSLQREANHNTCLSTSDIVARKIKIIIIYRSYCGENNKKRPYYYSKTVSLMSFLRAVKNLSEEYDLVYLNDGPIQADCLQIMEQTGEVIAMDKLGCQGSMRTSFAISRSRNWGSNDIIWFAEDDYLYLPNALTDLLEIARLYPQIEYFGLYASFRNHREKAAQNSYAHMPSRWRTFKYVNINGYNWCRALSTTSTFGVRASTLSYDRRMMEWVMRSGGAWDHTTCLMYQGYVPFSWRKLHDHFGSAASWKRKTWSVFVRFSLNIWQVTRRMAGERARLLVAPIPSLATHLETEYLADGTDWAVVAADCLAWGKAHGLIPDLGMSSLE